MANESYMHYVTHDERSGGNGLDRGVAQDFTGPYDDYPNIMAPENDRGPKLGATFYPGGFDDFQMPELISPSPQRIMPEVPSNMQEGIAHLELEAREVPRDIKQDRMSSVSSMSSSYGQYYEPVSPMQRAAPQLPQVPTNPTTTYTAAYEPAPYQKPAQQPPPQVPDRNAAYEPAHIIPYQRPAQQPPPQVPDRNAAYEPAYVAPYQQPAQQPPPQVPDRNAAYEPAHITPYQKPAQQPQPQVPDRNAAYEPAHVAPYQQQAQQPPPQVPNLTAAYEPAHITPYQKPAQQPPPQVPDRTAAYDHTNSALYQTDEHLDIQGRVSEHSKPSLFPKIRDAGPHVPPSDEGMLARLESARNSVLSSEDAEKQVAWAQDTLSWVDNAQQDRIRTAEYEPTSLAPSAAEDQLRTDALSIVNFLADQHHPKALFLRGTWYEFGKLGYPLNRKEAFDFYRAAVTRGFGRAEYRIGTQYEAMHDMAKAIKHYTGGETMGDSASNYRLGMMALLGQHGQKQDHYKALQRIRYAAETADENAPQGAYVYGMLLARELPNITVPESVLAFDTDQAKFYIEKAAYLGFAKAQVKMGSAYELCLLGCDFNPALSLHYNALAARQGEADADMAISKWFLCGFEGIFDKNEELAFRYAKRAAQAGLPTAEFAMGYFYEIGMHVPSNLHESKNWYQKAADRGNRDAMARLESISQQQVLSKKDHEQIAITRIKSQYGSQRGKRPEHLRQKSTPLAPTVEERVEERVEEKVEERVDMPDPKSVPSPRAGNRNSFMFITEDTDPPPRSKSTAPYPIEETNPPPRSKSTAPYPIEEETNPPPRSKSTAPYPIEEETNPRPRSKSTAPYPDEGIAPGYGQRSPPRQREQDMPNPRVRPLTGPPADRPLSAFGIRAPNIQPQNQYGQGRNSYSQVRPSVSMGNMAAVPEGRGHNPGGRNQIVSAGWEPQPASSGYLQPNLQPMPLNLQQKPTTDNGRQQPYDNNYGGRNKLQKPPPNMSKPQPSLPPQRLAQGPGYPVTPVMSAAVPNSGYTVPPPRGSSLAPAAAQTRYDAPQNNAAGHVRLNSLPGSSRYDQPNNNSSGHARLNSIPGQNRHDQPNKNQQGSGRLNSLPSQDARASLPSSTGQRFDSRQQGSQRPPLPHSVSQPPRNSSSLAPNSSAPPRASSAAPKSTSQPPRPSSATSNSVPHAPSGKPMKEGPKTFDEMGIPAQKNESDCAVM